MNVGSGYGGNVVHSVFVLLGRDALELRLACLSQGTSYDQEYVFVDPDISLAGLMGHVLRLIRKGLYGITERDIERDQWGSGHAATRNFVHVGYGPTPLK